MGGGGWAGTRQGHGLEPEDQAKLEATARAPSAGTRESHCRDLAWVRKRQRPRPWGESPLGCSGLGTGQAPGAAPSWVLEGLVGVSRPQTPARALLYALNVPCRPPGKVWAIYN